MEHGGSGGRQDACHTKADQRPVEADDEAVVVLDETEILRLAACLEEHFPHSMANAVVEEARRRAAWPRGRIRR